MKRLEKSSLSKKKLAHAIALAFRLRISKWFDLSFRIDLN